MEKIIRVKDLSKEVAKREVRKYLKRRDKAWLDEIADDPDYNRFRH